MRLKYKGNYKAKFLKFVSQPTDVKTEKLMAQCIFKHHSIINRAPGNKIVVVVFITSHHLHIVLSQTTNSLVEFLVSIIFGFDSGRL